MYKIAEYSTQSKGRKYTFLKNVIVANATLQISTVDHCYHSVMGTSKLRVIKENAFMSN